MKGLAAVVKGSISISTYYINKSARLPSNARTPYCSPVAKISGLTSSLSILRVMEAAGRNRPSSNAQKKTNFKAKAASTAAGNKKSGASGKQIFVPKGQKQTPTTAMTTMTTTTATPEAAAVKDNVDVVEREEANEIAEISKPQEAVSKKAVKSKLMTRAQVRATFYPKFENEKSDQEVRTKMIQVVSAGQGVVEVSLKHSGSLFLYSGGVDGGSFAKNSYGNLYTAVGVFVLGRVLKEAWGAEAAEKQSQFSAHLQKQRLSVAMELVTAVLGDHGQRPLQDYVVVTAVTDLKGRPTFYSTAEVVAFCHEWRLPANQLWLFSTKKSVISFFSAYDALCEEGTATSVTKVLDELCDLTVPGIKSHKELQGEILEGLVTRVVDPLSINSMEKALLQHPVPKMAGDVNNLGPGLRELCATNKDSEDKQIKALLENTSKGLCGDCSEWLEDKTSGTEPKGIETFLQACPTDSSTIKLQELCNTLRSRKLPVRFKCRTILHGEHGSNLDDEESTSFRMTIHVLSDSAFRRYQTEMRKQPTLWPLYRGFFVDVDVFYTKEDSSAPQVNRGGEQLGNLSVDQDSDIVDVGENLMLKLKFLPYKLRTFLIRNGLSTLLNKGVAEYKTYYKRQMTNWGTSASKKNELVQLLDEWASYARKHLLNNKHPQDSYLTVAEPFLERYAQRSAKNQRLIGSAGSLVDVEDFLAVPGERSDDEESTAFEEDSSNQMSSATDSQSATAVKAKGMLVFFPGIPGSAKSVLCAEIRKTSEFGYQHHLMGDLTKGKYWQILAEQRKKKPEAVTLADKNAPTDEVWKQIETLCQSSQAIGIPVIVDCEGTAFNPYSLDALALFMYRVLQRTGHPGKLDKNSPNPGAVLLLFYNLFNGKDRESFERELYEQFGHLVKMPLFKANRESLPNPISKVIQQGLDLQRKHTAKHGRMESTKGTFKDAWAEWERQLREIFKAHSLYMDSIQIPLQDSVKSVVEQLLKIKNSDFNMHVPKATEDRSFNTFSYAAVKLPKEELGRAMKTIVAESSEARNFLSGKGWEQSLGKAHITLAHKRSHGVAAVAAYGGLRGSPAAVQITALLFSDKLCALEALLDKADKQQPITALNNWPHVTVWTGQGKSAKDANELPRLVDRSEAQRISFSTPLTITGTVDFV